VPIVSLGGPATDTGCRPGANDSILLPSLGKKCSVANKRRRCYDARMDEGRKRVIGMMAAILASLYMRNADDLFGGPPREPEDGQVDSGEHSVG
jgi:hypothetical protein